MECANDNGPFVLFELGYFSSSCYSSGATAAAAATAFVSFRTRIQKHTQWHRWTPEWFESIECVYCVLCVVYTVLLCIMLWCVYCNVEKASAFALSLSEWIDARALKSFPIYWTKSFRFFTASTDTVALHSVFPSKERTKCRINFFFTLFALSQAEKKLLLAFGFHENFMKFRNQNSLNVKQFELIIKINYLLKIIFTWFNRGQIYHRLLILFDLL